MIEINPYKSNKKMSELQYSDVNGRILNGYTDDGINTHDGWILKEAVGYAKITTTPQTQIPIFLPSQAQSGGELVVAPDKPLILPAGATVCRVGLRLPLIDPNKTTQYGNLPVGQRLIGATGEKVKVNTIGTFTGTGTSIACVANAYTPNASSTVNRALNGADAPTSMIQTYGSASQVFLLNSNSGDTAAGTGISTSAGVALAIVQVCWYELQPALNYEDLGYQSAQKGN